MMSTVAVRPEYAIQLANAGTWNAATGFNELATDTRSRLEGGRFATAPGLATESQSQVSWLDYLASVRS